MKICQTGLMRVRFPAGESPARRMPPANRARQKRSCRPSVPAVSKTAKADAPVTEASLPFEEALQKLESIVESMESGELTLEQMLARFEEGARLSKTCQRQLESAEVRVQQLEKSLAGDLSTRPVEFSAEDSGS